MSDLQNAVEVRKTYKRSRPTSTRSVTTMRNPYKVTASAGSPEKVKRSA